jgi:hypothetical protein
MFIAWLTRRWVLLALLLGVSLLLLAFPLVHRMQWSTFILLVYLETPLYMLHQVEEHTGDRFRVFMNRQIFGGVDALTPTAVLITNIPGVWGVTALSLYLAVCVAAGWGLLGLYLIAVNAIVHIAGLIVWRKYHPGLWTAILLFLPLSIIGFWESAAAQATRMQHVIGLCLALAIHAALVVHTRRRAALLRSVRA